MKKVLLALALIGFSSSVYAQATFPVTNKRIVTDLWCDALATKLEADARYWISLMRNSKVMKDADQPKKADMGVGYLTQRTSKVIAQLADESTIYKNLCMK